MLAKPDMRRCIPPPHGKIYCIYIDLAQVISKAHINKPISKYAGVKICASTFMHVCIPFRVVV